MNKQVKKFILDKQINLKKFRSIYLSLSAQNYEKLSQDMESFIQKIKNKYANKSIKNKNIYKINFQAYPVTYQQKKEQEN